MTTTTTPPSSSKILITGGAGFIGSNLVDHFLQQGHTVICLDNFSTGKRENLIEASTNHQVSRLIVSSIKTKSICNLTDCQKAVDGCDYVLHQAALGGVPRSINDPITTNDVNIGGFLNMLVAARDAKVKRFVYAVSSSTFEPSMAEDYTPKIRDCENGREILAPANSSFFYYICTMSN